MTWHDMTFVLQKKKLKVLRKHLLRKNINDYDPLLHGNTSSSYRHHPLQQ